MNKYLSELMDTFALVFYGTGAMIINQVQSGVITHAGVAITFGLVVMIMIYALDIISVTHMNPAVTIVTIPAARFSIKQVLPYIKGQLLGINKTHNHAHSSL